MHETETRAEHLDPCGYAGSRLSSVKNKKDEPCR
jgi:hypothetical protein